jgi:hypothetical protein
MLRALKQQVGACVYVAEATGRADGGNSGGVPERLSRETAGRKTDKARPKKGWGEKVRVSQESYESWRELAQPFRCEQDRTFVGASVSVVRKTREHGEKWQDQSVLVVFIDDSPSEKARQK